MVVLRSGRPGGGAGEEADDVGLGPGDDGGVEGVAAVVVDGVEEENSDGKNFLGEDPVVVVVLLFFFFV